MFVLTVPLVSQQAQATVHLLLITLIPQARNSLSQSNSITWNRLSYANDYNICHRYFFKIALIETVDV